MATLVLSTAGAALGTALGGPLGGIVGRAAGGLAGAALDQAILGGTQSAPRERVGPRLTNVQVSASTEGAPITRLIGRARLSGQMIWATRFEEEARTETEGAGGSGGGKGLGGGSTAAATTTTTYSYYANFAVAFCEGPVERIGRIWADGREIDQDRIDVAKRLGSEDQDPDSTMAAKEGDGNVPAYRGIAHVVFRRLPLADHGNRIPMITAEVFRRVGHLEEIVKGISIIPGSTEFGYDTAVVSRSAGFGAYETENRHTKLEGSAFSASLDMLREMAPNLETVVLVVAWFGTDLRCGTCEIKPKVEIADKTTYLAEETGAANEYPWIVAGLSRAEADIVSQYEGRPAYGGAPNDRSVIAAVKELKARGYRVLFYPFVMMDIEHGNGLADPYSDNAGSTGQAPYPWRGRITCSPAAGFAGSPDRSSGAAAQVAAFVGTAAPEAFAWSGQTVTYSGSPEWSYRRFVLHMAVLAREGGADAFTIGSEMVGMTTVRSDGSSYPFVQALKALAGDARQILGPEVLIGYAADWSEYHSHRPDDGSGDVHFHLDPLWSDEEIDFVGIDNYLPLSDWRDGTEHLDYDGEGPTVIHDLDYLKANVEGGEYYDWHYASAADRDGQARTPIEDTAHGEHWVFRNKDIRNWWASAHHDRPGGTRAGSPTGWVPQGKPIFMTEVGCPAVDKGSNQPNVFFDPKSSESFLPHYSTGARDDAIQRAYLRATIEHWEDGANNPISSVYGGRMMATDWTSAWTWDARMAPSFPLDEATWADGGNWHLGHWLSARFGSAPATETIAEIARLYGVSGDIETQPMGGVVDGVVIDRVMSARAVYDALQAAYLYHPLESEGRVRFEPREGSPVRHALSATDLVEEGEAEPWRKTRAQETEIPAVVKVTYGEVASDDQPGGVEARRTVGGSRAVEAVDLPCTMPEARARAIAETLLREAWVGREELEAVLPPSLVALDAGDVIRFSDAGNETWRIVEIADAEARRMRLRRTDGSLFGGLALPGRGRQGGDNSVLGRPEVAFLDGPLLRDGDDDWRGYVAAYLDPWPGGIALYRSPEGEGFALDSVVAAPGRIGWLTYDFYSGPVWRWDRVNELYVTLPSGTLASASELQVLNGANALAIENGDGEWEVVQFASAELQDTGRYRLTDLLRGQRGTEHAMRDPVGAGARVVMLDGAVQQPQIPPEHVGLELNWRAGPASRPVTDGAYRPFAATLNGKARRPLAPVRLAARWEDEDIHLSWVRRTRIGGDAWSVVEVPLGEEAEAYDLQILSADGASVAREVASLAGPAWTYTAAEQTSDFGAPLTAIRFRVHQLSGSYGRGIPADYP